MLNDTHRVPNSTKRIPNKYAAIRSKAFQCSGNRSTISFHKIKYTINTEIVSTYRDSTEFFGLNMAKKRNKQTFLNSIESNFIGFTLENNRII